MLRVLIAAILLLAATAAYAGQSVIDFTDVMPTYTPDYTRLQTTAPNPLLTLAVPDNYSHTLTLSSVAASSTAPIIYFTLYFNGTGAGCIARLMHTTTRASWVAYPITAGQPFGLGINPNTLFINYSGCYN
jgi:hypothetical protein